MSEADVDVAPADAQKMEEKLREVRTATSRRMFDSVDTDNSGFIEADEFQRLCRKLDATMSANDIKLAMNVLDDSGDGKISFEEFSNWWAAGSPEENLKQLRKAVSAADQGGMSRSWWSAVGARCHGQPHLPLTHAAAVCRALQLQRSRRQRRPG